MVKKFYLLILCFLLSSCFENTHTSKICENKNSTLIINNIKINVEHACSYEQMSLGLMNRNKLDLNSGMMFVFKEPKQLEFWMKNTYIPLDIAFIDENQIITQIEHMNPLDETIISSKLPNKFALETNLNWFKSNNIKVGDKVNF